MTRNVLFKLLVKVPEVGVYNSCFAAAAPKVREDREKWKGTYLDPVGSIAEPRREGLAKELWDKKRSWRGSKYRINWADPSLIASSNGCCAVIVRESPTLGRWG